MTKKATLNLSKKPSILMITSVFVMLTLFSGTTKALKANATEQFSADSQEFSQTYTVTGNAKNGYSLASGEDAPIDKADALAVISGIVFAVSPIQIIFGSEDNPVSGQFTFPSTITTNCDVYINGYVTGNFAEGTIRNESSRINLFFTGGTVEATGDAGVAVYNYRGGKVMVSEPDPDNKTRITSKNSAYSSGTVHLTGGTEGQTILEMKGGTVENKGGVATPHYAKAIYHAANGTIAISGGTVNGGPGSAICANSTTNAKIEISEPDPENKTLIFSKKTTSSGFDTIELGSYSGSKSLTMTGGTVRSESNYSAIDLSGSAVNNISISGGTVDGGPGRALCFTYNNDIVGISGTAIITSDVASASNGTIYFYNYNNHAGGSLNILGGTIKNTTSTGNIIYNDANGSYPGIIGTVNILPVFTDWEDLTYDGTAKNVSAEIAAKFFKGTTQWKHDLSVKYRVKDGADLQTAPSASGEYTAYIEGSAVSVHNAPCNIPAISQDYRIAIDKGAGTVSIAGWTYGEAANDPTYNITKGDHAAPTYEYKVKNADDSTYISVVPADVGYYTIRAIFAATTNHGAFTATCDFSISPKTLTNELQDIEGTFIYDGSAQTPTVVVTGLTEDVDYTISYSNNTNAGMAIVIITGIGNYIGTISKEFAINKTNGSGTVSIEGWKGKESNNPTCTGMPEEYGEPIYEYKAKGADDSTYTTKKPVKPGKYIVRARFEATVNYEAYVTESVEFTIFSDTLSGGILAGIVIGSMLLIAIAGFGVFWFAIKKKSFRDLTHYSERNN